MRIKHIIILFITFCFFSCSRKEKAVITGNIQNASGAKAYLQELRITSVRTIDSMEVKKNGNFRFNISMDKPGYYQLNFTGNKSLTLILSPGEKFHLETDMDNFYSHKTLEGSDNTERVNELHDSLRSTILELNVIRSQYLKLDSLETNNSTGKDSLEVLYNKTQKDHHRYSVEFIFKDLASLANIAALYQEFTPGQYVFNSQFDIQFFKLVSDSLTKYYPKVRQVTVLNDNYQSMISVYQTERLMQMADVEESGVPHLSLPDHKGREVSISSLKGKTVLLSFWSVNQNESIGYVVELKKIYEKYKNYGFEIYQVSIDKSEEKWKRALEFEEFSWVNVIDTAFPASPTYILFNVKEVPMNYLIDAGHSEILAKNLSPVALENTLSKLLIK